MPFTHWFFNIRQKDSAIQNPITYWFSQPDSELKRLALQVFSHRVSNASLESFFSTCKSFIGLNSNSLDIETLEELAIISANYEILEEKVINPIRLKYNA